MTGRMAAMAALAGLVTACAAAGASPQGAAEGGAGRAEGIVRVVGSAPLDVQVVVQPDGAEAVRITGPLRDEIRRLSGARVVVHGDLERSEAPVASRQLQATDYEIVSINGQPVVVGTVQGRTGGWTVLRTRDGGTIYLSAVPESIRTGQTIWVQGQQSLVVQSFGVLDPGRE
jgi:hypothetical protein